MAAHGEGTSRSEGVSKCKSCTQTVSDDDGVRCDLCREWMHASCMNMTKGLLREINRAGKEKKSLKKGGKEHKGSVHWYGLECSKAVKKGMLRSVLDLKARIRTLEEEVSKFMIEEEEEELDEMKEEMETAKIVLEENQAASENDGEGEEDEINEERESADVASEVYHEAGEDDGEGVPATEEVCQEEVREVEEDWINRWQLAGRKRPARIHTIEMKVDRAERPAGLELRNRFELLEVECKEVHKHAVVESSNSETVLMGSSMVGGVGKALEVQLEGKFAWRKYSGARIEDITRRLEEVELGSDVKNLVLMVGTNNLKSDGTNIILKKYEELIRTAKEKRIRNVTIVGIVCRNDVGEYHECKRYAINAKLKKKCEMMGVYYVEMDVMYKDRNRVLCRDGLHLNDRGGGRDG